MEEVTRDDEFPHKVEHAFIGLCNVEASLSYSLSQQQSAVLSGCKADSPC